MDTNNAWFTSVDGVLFNKDQTTLIAYPGARSGSYAVPGTVTNIADEAFAYSQGLSGVELPASVASIGEVAFVDCPVLPAIAVDTNNAFYSSVDGVLLNKDQSVLIACPGGRSGCYAVPGTVTNITEQAFEDCEGLLGIVVPGSVSSIASETFALLKLDQRHVLPGFDHDRPICIPKVHQPCEPNPSRQRHQHRRWDLRRLL